LVESKKKLRRNPKKPREENWKRQEEET